MNNAVKVSELPAKWRAKAKRIRGMTAGSDLVADIMEVSAEDLEAALARKESAPISVDRLAQIIRRLDSRQLTGAHEMAEAILAEVSIPAPPSAPVGQDKPLTVFDKGPWVYMGTGQEFSGSDLDEAAFVVYRNTAPPAAQAVDLPDDFSESKDWRESDYNGRINWLKAMHASQRAEIVRLQNDVEILRTLIDQQAGKGMSDARD